MSADPHPPIASFPKHWHTLSLVGKRRYLVDSGQARDWSHASSLLSRHGALVRARRKARKFDRRAARPLQQPFREIERTLIESASVRATCDACGTVCYELLYYSDAVREKRLVTTFRQDKFSLLCLACVETPRGQEIMLHGRQDERRAA